MKDVLLDPKSKKTGRTKAKVVPIATIASDDMGALHRKVPAAQSRWIKANGFEAASGQTLLIPEENGAIGRRTVRPWGVGGCIDPRRLSSRQAQQRPPRRRLQF